MSSSSLPKCLLASVPVMQPSHLEGNSTLATEILPGPPSLLSVQQSAQRKDFKKIVNSPRSYLPSSDPGSTYGAVSLSNGAGQAAPAAAGSEPDAHRRKRLRVDQGLSRAERASARRPPTPLEGDYSVENILSPDGPLSSPPSAIDNVLQEFPFPTPPPAASDREHLQPAAALTANNLALPESQLSAPEGGRRSRRVDKGKEKAVVRIKQEPVTVSLSDPVISHVDMANEDHCSACSSLGALVYCDSCPKAFHLWCLNPPMEAQDLPGDDTGWYCPACRLRDHPPPRPPPGLLSALIQNVQTSIPVEFRLPDEIKGFYKDVTTGLDGSYIDTSNVKPPRLNRHGQLEDRDPHRLKDRNGHTVLCYKCGTSALPGDTAPPPTKRPKRSTSMRYAGLEVWKPIVSCDHCDLHWHLDCLDPPMLTMPPFGKKWMCPNHVDQILPKRRVPRNNAPMIDINKSGQANNGNIEVVPSDLSAVPHERFGTDEVLINGRRYKIPERVIVLDFWGKILEQRSGPKRPEEPTSRDSSPLTSLSSLDEIEAGNDTAGQPVPSYYASPTQSTSKVSMNDQQVAELLCSMGKLRFVNRSVQTEPTPPETLSGRTATRSVRVRKSVSHSNLADLHQHSAVNLSLRNTVAGPFSTSGLKRSPASGRASPRSIRSKKTTAKPAVVKTEDTGGVIPPASLPAPPPPGKRPRGRPRKNPPKVSQSASASHSVQLSGSANGLAAPLTASPSTNSATLPYAAGSVSPTKGTLTIRLPRLNQLHAMNGSPSNGNVSSLGAASSSVSAPAAGTTTASPASIRRSSRRQKSTNATPSITSGSPLKASQTLSDFPVSFATTS